MARMLIVIGILCIAAGLGWMFLDQVGLSRLLGHLPGDLNFTKGNVSFHFPVVTCIIISVILTVLLNVFFHR
ncbi:DUF2905 domain-containing protein [Megasphaera paucivorans]|uniref:DUF2905 domain-containing protein n=1 Tax=Megasphaera paucivorans TaxID=349095 RepID=A0A1G9UUY9_9FIRM|nr:DUF2905 domain-containing protein [Megasphaera paucivorans]SDM63708.1 Protein of unknown function [Megasphaera paucivorans]